MKGICYNFCYFKFSNFQLPAYPIIIYYASREFLILFEPYYFKQTDR